MVELRSGNWNDLGRLAERLRMEVFVKEQGVPREIEIDEFDPICRHVVAVNRLGHPVATGRLVSDAPGVGRIGRMAVAREMRGGALGRQVLDTLIQAARDRGDKEVVLHAQLHAQRFTPAQALWRKARSTTRRALTISPCAKCYELQVAAHILL